MPRVIVTERAAEALERTRKFLADKSPEAARRAAHVIDQHLLRLEMTPELGRPVPGILGLRELIMPFGDSGYLALYRYLPEEGAVYVLAFRHQKEAGY